MNEINPALVIEDETVDKNLRYIGNNPNNYIWFNCDNYELVTNNTIAEEQNCEKWRIIGLMNNITIIDEATQEEIPNQNLVKIIKAESIGNIAWDSANKNNWAKSSLQISLNTIYYSGKDLNNRKGINDLTRKMIEQVKWNIGGHSTYDTAAQYYVAERGKIVPSGALPTWDGYIGLMYASDYGYATDKSCWATNLNYYLNNGCHQKDWLYTGNYQWTITPYSQSSDFVFSVADSGPIIGYNGNPSLEYGVYPSLYLKYDVKIKSGIGDGSEGNPYIIVP